MSNTNGTCETSRKIVVVGDGMVGKTALLSAFVDDVFHEDYVPTIFETSAKDVELPDGRHVTLGLWDTGGQEEFDQIRQLAYPGASLILMCYAVDCPTSLENIVHTWVGEVKAYCPQVPLILVGCKADRRCFRVRTVKNAKSTNQIPFVDPTEAQKVGQQIGAHVTIECSASTRSNIQTIFELAARIILDLEANLEKPTTTLCHLLQVNRNRSFSNGLVSRFSLRNSIRKQRTSSGTSKSTVTTKTGKSPNYCCFFRRT